MILETTIPPRKDRCVIARTPGGVLTFAPNNYGVLSCDVQDLDAIKQLLDTGNFSPASEADFAAAITLQAEPVQPAHRKGRK